MTTHLNAPPPNLKIVPTEAVLAHEEHDSQRAIPLIEAIRNASVVTNPPIVAQIEDTDQYVILDGANRCYSFKALQFPHLLVQVVDYNSPFVELMTWHHVVSDWDIPPFLEAIHQLDGVYIGQKTGGEPPLRPCICVMVRRLCFLPMPQILMNVMPICAVLWRFISKMPDCIAP